MAAGKRRACAGRVKLVKPGRQVQLEPPRLLLCHVLQNPVETFQPLRADFSLVSGLVDGAAGVTHVSAIAEFAGANHLPDFPEAILDFLRCHMPEPELTNARRVDQLTAKRQVEQFGRGCGMNSLAGAL